MTLIAGMTYEICLQVVHQALQAQPLYYGHGTDNAWDEACWLLDFLQQESGEEGHGTLSERQVRRLAGILKRRIRERVPLAYLLQEAWFAGVPFYVDERVLIPRSPYAELILNGFEPVLAKPPRRILDLCTGSGCIGIACALMFPEASVDLADISPDALDVARINIQRYKLEDRVRPVLSDLFACVDGPYDLIVSNPPYVSGEEYAGLPEEYQREPGMALLSEQEGLAIPLRIVREAGPCMTADATIFLEVGNNWEKLEAALPNLSFLWLEFERGGEGICALKAEQLGA